MSAIPKPKPDLARLGLIVYPESDGKPTSDNTKQRRWIRLIECNLLALYRDDPAVFVAGDLLWYPVEGFPEIRAAPDAMVAFGRPKGDRGSYLQWEEGGVAPQVVFEILSPSNSHLEMEEKRDWYEEHGVEEYYVFDPEQPNKLRVYVHDGAIFRTKKPPHGFVSPRLKIRFDLSGAEMAIYYPDGRRFLTIEELDAIRSLAEQQAGEARKLADEARRQADEARSQADEATRRSRRLAELSRKARRGEANADELAELDRLESEAAGG
jgi:Uma2 family endonuclease